jgi:hypothetical protein
MRPLPRAAWSVGSVVVVAVVACRPGRPPERDAAPLARADTVDMFSVAGGRRTPAGTVIHGVARATRDGRDVYLLTIATASPGGGTSSWDTLAVDARSAAPLWRRSHAPTDSAHVVYVGRRARGTVAPHGSAARVIDRELDADVVESGALLWLVSRQPLEATTVRAYRAYDMWADATRPVSYQVVGRDSLERGGRRVHAWVVREQRGAEDSVRAGVILRTMWVDATTGRVLRTHNRLSRTPETDGFFTQTR